MGMFGRKKHGKTEPPTLEAMVAEELRIKAETALKEVDRLRATAEAQSAHVTAPEDMEDLLLPVPANTPPAGLFDDLRLIEDRDEPHPRTVHFLLIPRDESYEETDTWLALCGTQIEDQLGTDGYTTVAAFCEECLIMAAALRMRAPSVETELRAREASSASARLASGAH
jgi:hypothetical protein